MTRSKVLAYHKIEEILKPDGTKIIRRTTKGFNAFEVLGVVECARSEIVAQITGQMPQPKIIERKVIVEK